MRAKDIILGLDSLMNVFEALLARALTIDYLIFIDLHNPSIQPQRRLVLLMYGGLGTWFVTVVSLVVGYPKYCNLPLCLAPTPLPVDVMSQKVTSEHTSVTGSNLPKFHPVNT